MKNINWKSATTILITINIVIYFLEQFIFPNLVITAFQNGNSANPISHLIWYFVSAFSHTSLIHLFFNMTFLYYIGRLLEFDLGKRDYLIYYFVVVVLSGFLIDIISANNILIIGASGVLYSFFAAIIVLYHAHVFKLRININNLYFILIINVAFTLIAPDVSRLGHFVGFIAGFLVTLIYLLITQRHMKNRR